jgi:SAM-dependent methyltransferase
MIRSVIQTVAQTAWRVSSLGTTKGAHIVRYQMYKEIQRDLCGHSLGERVLSISHSSRLCGLLNVHPEHVVEANYPEQNICRLSYPDGTFSAVVSDQVFEHIASNPGFAVDEVYRILAPGGIAVHTTCFLTPYHGSPDYQNADNGDYWRFTPSGLALLHSKYSRIIAARGWGNTLMPVINGLGLTRMPVPEASWHPINRMARLNRASYHYVVWVIAQK